MRKGKKRAQVFVLLLWVENIFFTCLKFSRILMILPAISWAYGCITAGKDEQNWFKHMMALLQVLRYVLPGSRLDGKMTIFAEINEQYWRRVSCKNTGQLWANSASKLNTNDLTSLSCDCRKEKRKIIVICWIVKWFPCLFLDILFAYIDSVLENRMNIVSLSKKLELIFSAKYNATH